MKECVAPSRGCVAASASLLAHYWSRPVAAEVECWLEMAQIEASTRHQLSGDSGPGDSGLPYGAEQVPALLDEYERLFVGPGQVPCPPYESFWRDDVEIDLWHSLMGPCIAELRKLYREIGIDVNPAAGELPDHVAVEFEALSYALSCPDGGRVAEALVTGHLSQWMPRLCAAVTKEAQHSFYAELAEVTAEWLGHIQCHLTPPEVKPGPASRSGPSDPDGPPG